MEATSSGARWARLRFLVVGPLLAAPAAPGQLRLELARLAETVWPHPVTGQPTSFGRSTIERWYYQARAEADPIRALRRKERRDRGRFIALRSGLADTLWRQYQDHPAWSVKLHRDNLLVLAADDESLGRVPSYSTLRRYMAHRSWRKMPRLRRPGQAAARVRRESREVRSFESEHVAGLWHLDFHHASRKILIATEWVRPILLAVLDDRSRLICHAQWYLDEKAESLVHGLVQAILKRGLPRSLMTDNGGAMTADETTEGLGRLGIVHETTLPYSPHQNGKQEVFWGQVEGRLLAMLEGEPELSLSLLNRATLAWVEQEYQRTAHSETRQTPLDRWLEGPSVARVSPSLDDLRSAFTTRAVRVQRRSDGTISLLGQRFEVPDRFRHQPRIPIRYASWDLRSVWIVDGRTDELLQRCLPLDRTKNADRVRRSRHLTAEPIHNEAPPVGVAPLLRKLMADYAATGLPPAYIPTEEA